MKQVKINVYKFDELDLRIQDKVLDTFRELETFDFLEDNLKEHLFEILKKNKLQVNNPDSLRLLFSLNNCQGDGLMFECVLMTPNIEIQIKHNSSHYYNYCTADFDLISLRIGKNWKYTDELTEKQEKRAEFLINNFKETYRNICNELEKIGYDIMENALSDEVIKEQIEINDFLFFEDGSIHKEE